MNVDVKTMRTVVEDCERMLRFSPPPKHLAESGEWQAAIQSAQQLLQALPDANETVATAKRVHDLEILVMVYDAMVYCMLPFFRQHELADIVVSQVSACADAHAKIMGEPAMYGDKVPKYEPKDIPPVDKK